MRINLLKRKIMGILAGLLVLFMAVGVAEDERMDASGQWKYVLGDDGATVTKYLVRPSGDVAIPSELDGFTVTSVGKNLFYMDESLTGVTIPEGVISIGDFAF